MRRRQVLRSAGLLALPALPGCLGGSSPSATDGTARPGTGRDATTAVATTTTTRMEPTASTPERTTDSTTATPSQNETPFRVAWQWHLDDRLVVHADHHPGDGPRVALLTDDDWRRTVDAAVLAAPARSFVKATDFTMESVVTVEAPTPAAHDRLRLRSIDGVGQGWLALQMTVLGAGSDLVPTPDYIQDPTWHLLLVRVPDRGETPTDARVTVASGGDRLMGATSYPPRLSETPYPAVAQWNVGTDPITGHDAPAVELLTSDDWRRTVDEDWLSTEIQAFLTATDFDSHSVVAFQRSVSAGGNRLVLRAVDGVGTPTLAIDVLEYKPGSPLNNAPTHLLLVRVPNRGVEPTTVRVAALREAEP